MHSRWTCSKSKRSHVLRKSPWRTAVIDATRSESTTFLITSRLQTCASPSAPAWRVLARAVMRAAWPSMPPLAMPPTDPMAARNRLYQWYPRPLRSGSMLKKFWGWTKPARQAPLGERVASKARRRAR